MIKSFRKLLIFALLLQIVGFLNYGFSYAECPVGIISYWNLNETIAGNYQDEISFVQGVCEGDCPVYSLNGRFGGGQKFDGDQSGLRIPSDALYDWNFSNSFTIEMWVNKPAGTLNGEQVLIGRSMPGGAVFWKLSVTADGKLSFLLKDSNGTTSLIQSLTSIADGNWHHLVASRDANSNLNELYVDTNLEASASANYTGNFWSSDSLISIGFSDDSGANNYEGLLDEIALYDQVLSDFDIIRHFNDGLLDHRWGYCDERLPIRIMPLGDSITVGTGSTNKVGYRKKLYHDLEAKGFSIDFVGSISNGLDTIPPFDINHEGHGGWSDDQIAVNVYSWLASNPADIVLLHIGTNGLEADPTDVDNILDEIDRYSEDITVVLAKIINRATYSATTTQFNRNIEAMAVDRIAHGDKIVLVDQESALTYPDDMYDAVHPNNSGYEKMAAVWLNGLEQHVAFTYAFAPSIISDFPLAAAIGYEFYYDVNATGKPAPTYQLVDINNSLPTGLTIDLITGEMIWLPDLEGVYEISVTAVNSEGEDFQTFTVEVLDGTFVDNGQPGTSQVGTWSVSSGENPFGEDSLFAKTVGARYTYQASASGTLEVALWWTEFSNRCAQVPVEIYDGTMLLDTVYVNQLSGGRQWNVLGSYRFSSGTARVVIVSTDSCTTCADGVQFAASSLPALDHVEIEGSESVNENSTSGYQLRAYYVDGSHQLVSADGWSVNAAIADISSNGLLSTAEVNQNEQIRITATYSENGESANAIWDVLVTDFSGTVIDNGDPGTSQVGIWPDSSGENPYGTVSVYSKKIGARYTYQASASGTLELALWWTDFSNRCTQVPVEIYDGTMLLDTVYVNQLSGGGQWNVLGNYRFDSGTARVVIVSTDSCTTCADAVQFAASSLPTLDHVEIEGLESVNENSTSGYQLRAYYVDGSHQLVSADGWSVNAANADISSNGLLSTAEVNQNEQIRITATYSENGESASAILDVLVTDFSGTVIDNGDPGTSQVGTWSNSSGENPYGTVSVYAKTAGARYTYQASASGTLELALWWTDFSNRCTQVPVEIYDGTVLLDTVYVNQLSGGGQWNVLGNYRFDSGTVRVRMISDGVCTTCADALKLQF